MYSHQGKYNEVIAYYKHSLKIFEKTFEVDHINIVFTINDLGSIYHSQGKYDEAIANYEYSLRIFEKAFLSDYDETGRYFSV